MKSLTFLLLFAAFFTYPWTPVSGQPKTDQPRQVQWVKGHFQYGKLIPLLLKVEGSGGKNVLEIFWVYFHRENSRIRADIRMKILSWPESRWQARITLLDADDQPLGSAEGVFRNAGFIISIPAISEEDLRFIIEPSSNQLPSRYRFEIQPVPNKTEVTTELFSPPRPESRPEGNLCIDVSLTDKDGKPAPKAEYIVWRRKMDRKPIFSPPSVLYSPQSVWQDEEGRIWEAVRSVFGSGEINSLQTGFYRIGAVSANPHHSNDPTPFGTSPMIALTANSKCQKLAVNLKGNSALVIKVIDQKSGKPRAQERVMLFLPDGMPIGDTEFGMHTNDDGIVRLGHLEPGLYRVEVGKRSWWADGTRLVEAKVHPGVENIIEIPFTGSEPQRLPGTAVGISHAMQ